MSPPRISTIIPAYNARSTLARALESVRTQTLASEEIIVVDDASTDDTARLAGEFPGIKVKVLRFEKNVGAAGARNHGVEQAAGEFVAFLDADDEWLPSKLEKQAAILISAPEVPFVSCDSDLISPEGYNLGNIYPGQKIVSGPLAWKALLAENFITTPSVLVRRSALERVGGFNRRLKIAEDQDLWIRLAELGPLGYVPESLVRVHERHKSLSGGSFDDQLGYTLPMIEGHLARLSPKLSSREIRDMRGRRLLRLGQLGYHRGAAGKGRQLIWQAVRSGYQPWQGLLFMATANKLALWLKYKLLGR